MKATELRIDNFVRVNDLLVTVNRIEIEKFWATYKNLLFFSGSETSPIPLTEEWLVKFGFKNSPNNLKLFRSFGYGLYIDEDGDCRIFTSHGGLEMRWITTIKYVHQLQNLYFAVSGQELIKEESKNG